jgi:ribonuclease P protein component
VAAPSSTPAALRAASAWQSEDPLQRLKTRAQFQAVLACGIVARTAHFALHRMQLEAPGPQVGVVLPKRWAKRAVTRNTIKRQVYSVSQAMQLSPAGYVVRLRVAFDRAQFPSAASDALKRAVRGELLQLFQRAVA